MKEYPIHDTSGGPTHGEAVPGKITYNPIPEEERCELLYKGQTIKVQIALHFYSDPRLSLIEIVEEAE